MLLTPPPLEQLTIAAIPLVDRYELLDTEPPSCEKMSAGVVSAIVDDEILEGLELGHNQSSILEGFFSVVEDLNDPHFVFAGCRGFVRAQ